MLLVPGMGPEVDMKVLVFLLLLLESDVVVARPSILIWCVAVMLFCAVCGTAVVRGI